VKVARSDGGLTVEVTSEAETERLGQALAARIRPGLVVGLIGPLGAGKTRLTRAIAEALGVPAEEIGSPTFVLIHEYAGRIPIYHFDTYRLRDPEEFDAIGADEYFAGDGVCLVEWADRVLNRLPKRAWLVRIEPDGEGRRFVLTVDPATADAILSTLPA
jgi:tRNA threonylcarbamoyladenosine biosynthesis protein TsaE